MMCDDHLSFRCFLYSRVDCFGRQSLLCTARGGSIRLGFSTGLFELKCLERGEVFIFTSFGGSKRSQKLNKKILKFFVK